jgi:selenocysteine-specific elongation factor
MIIGTAGHIDHGKTALVKALTGIDADRLAEEKRRGITIDLGYAYFPLADGTIAGFVDVPGHERFIHNMLAGATGIDAVLLVVAADDGVMPQTREHLQILDLLGIDRGLVALTKADLADDTLLARRKAEIEALLAGTGLAGAPVHPVSAHTGAGIAALREALGTLRREGPKPSGYPRLAIDRSFSLPGTGLVVTGTLFSGAIAVDDRLMLSPPGIELRVRGLHAQNRPAERAVQGQRCALNITGARLDKDRISRGDWVLAPQIHAPTATLDVSLKLLASEPKPLRHWTPVHVHLAAAHVTGRVALLEEDSLVPGGEAFAQLVLDTPIGALGRDRVILRDIGAQRTLGGGVVCDPFASPRKRRKPERLVRLGALRHPPERAAALLLEGEPGVVEEARFAEARNLLPAEADALWQRLGAVRQDGIAFSAATWEKARATFRETLAAYHAATPDTPGPHPERLRTLMPLRLDARPFAAVLNAEIASGEAVQDGPWVRLPTHKAMLAPADEETAARIERSLAAERFRPPRVRDFANEMAMNEELVRQLMRKMARMGRLVEVAKDHFYLRDTVAEMIGIAASLETDAPGGQFNAAAFRDRIDSGRKVAIQILEFFDRQGVTLRRGDLRRIRPGRHERFGHHDAGRTLTSGGGAE